MKMAGIGFCCFLDDFLMNKNFEKLEFLDNYQDKKPIVIKKCFETDSLTWEKINEIIRKK